MNNTDKMMNTINKSGGCEDCGECCEGCGNCCEGCAECAGAACSGTCRAGVALGECMFGKNCDDGCICSFARLFKECAYNTCECKCKGCNTESGANSSTRTNMFNCYYTNCGTCSRSSRSSNKVMVISNKHPTLDYPTLNYPTLDCNTCGKQKYECTHPKKNEYEKRWKTINRTTIK